MFNSLIEALRLNPRRIVFTEGTDARILYAAAKLKAGGFLTPVLVGEENAVRESAERGGFDISGVRIYDPLRYERMDALVEEMAALREGKQTKDECRELLRRGNYFGTMLVKAGEVDALLGGATYSTADTVRPALQLIKTKPGAHLVSSSMLLERGGERILFSDVAINIAYEDRRDKSGAVTLSAAAQLAEVAVETAKTARVFGIEPKVALLSFSTADSGRGGTVSLSREAAEIAKKLAPDIAIDGEMQFDAAVSPEVGQLKFPGSEVAGYANTFIFPNLESANIGVKIAQRLGGFAGYGPILQGLNAPINDLSRGCSAEEVYKIAIITAALA